MNDVDFSEKALLAPGDPAPFSVFNPDGAAPILVVCDHASNAVPARLHGLGLLERDLHRHIAYDIGAADMTRRLAERFDAPAVLGGYSRLVIDYNRLLEHPSSILTVSDGVEIPGNRDVSPAEARRRAEECFWPYHRQIEAMISSMLDRGAVPAILSIHSFTPVLGGVERPWGIGVLWDADERLSAPLVSALKARGDLVVGENEPYSGRARYGYSIEVHAEGAGLPGVLVEAREDLVADPEDARRIADVLADALAPTLSDSALYRRRAG